MEKDVDFLVGLLIYLNDNKLINNYDFCYETECKKYIKQNEPKKTIRKADKRS